MACWCGCSALKLFKDLMYCGGDGGKRPVGQEFGAERVGIIKKEGNKKEKI